MRTLVGLPIVAALWLAVSVNTAEAAYFGAASYRHCAGAEPASYCCAKQCCYQVMKTCRQVVWEKQEDEALGWEGRVLANHQGVVQSIHFQPDTLLLASAAEDGRVCLWHKAQRLAQVLNGAPNGFSCLAWHPKGSQFAAGGQNGELLVWSKAGRGQGFGQN